MNGTKKSIAAVLLGTVSIYVMQACPLPRERVCLTGAGECRHEPHLEFENTATSSSAGPVAVTAMTAMPTAAVDLSWPSS